MALERRRRIKLLYKSSYSKDPKLYKLFLVINPFPTRLFAVVLQYFLATYQEVRLGEYIILCIALTV